MIPPSTDSLKFFGRRSSLFRNDLERHGEVLNEKVVDGRFLVLGGAGSIGQAVTKELFRRSPRRLHVVDLSENNLVELVRDIRSSLGYIRGDFRTFVVDCGSVEFDALMAENEYDYVLNLAALKHVRSEKDAFSLMRMLRVNVLNTVRTLDQARSQGARKYFSVSTDKAANPVNLMGASKRIMEKLLLSGEEFPRISLARFANVAFSDGSLLDGFSYRFRKRQPLSAPADIQRYFMAAEEAGQLCMLSCLLGRSRENFFPKEELLKPLSFSELAVRFLEAVGYRAVPCDSEDEARERAEELITRGDWPCFFFESDTTGEKPLEEFFMRGESLDRERFEAIGVIKHDKVEAEGLRDFLNALQGLLEQGRWTRADLARLVTDTLPEFSHHETHKYLDERM